MPSSTTPGIVLDTNVVLDWLVFRDPACQALAAAIESGAVRWLAAGALRDELDDVLGRGVGAERQPDRAAIEAAWLRHAVIHPAAVPAAAMARRCRCSDPDDQKFIDLALAHGARWLLSRDRAVLKVAREARLFGLEIVAPSNWTPPSPDASAVEA
ncbi:PIN domain-containing protein [Piscinibacter sakaiensis]|uniref:PIN domain-containing protein n=1 Tax=Piscinibacter sakaiensis TaxID=1547922 RepID=UPI003AAA7093